VVVAGGVGAAVTGGAVLKAASAGAARRLVQTVVMFVVAAAAAAAGVLGLAMATSSNLAFQTAFTRYHGAHLAVTADAAKVTSSQLAATRRLPGVTRAAGPYLATTISVSISVPGFSFPPGMNAARGLRVVGRASRSGPLDEIIQHDGRWATREGEIDLSLGSPVRGPLGREEGRSGTVTVTSVAGKPTLAIAGYATSVVFGEEDGWVAPSEITALERAGAPAQQQMLYTFRHAATPAQISADLRELRAALPAGAIASYVTWLNTEYGLASAQGSTTPVLVAYAVIGLVLAVLITVIVAAAAVAAGYARIGVLKSIGFTPAQVAATYWAQLSIPALAGAIAGTVLGSRWARPMIGTGPFHVKVGVPAWVQVSVPLGLCALAGLAALAPAVRAGRLSAVQAITAGQAPRARRGYAAHRLVARMPLTRPASLGLAAPFSRPSRSAAMLAVVAAGLAAVVLAVGLDAHMHQIVLVPGWADNGVRLARQLTRLVAVLAGLGVFSAVLMLARERVHDLGIFKALGMTPRQLITMVTCWVIAPAIAAAVLALPAGIALEGAVARAVVSQQASRLAKVIPPPAPGAGLPAPRSHRTQPGLPRPGAGHQEVLPGATLPPHGARAGLPPQLAQLGTHLTHAYPSGTLALLVLAGLAIAIAGALGPAVWAAASKTTTALHAE
jgi:hypothetical protein